jgi:hypothetical protein
MRERRINTCGLACADQGQPRAALDANDLWIPGKRGEGPNVQKFICAFVAVFLLISTVMGSGKGRKFSGTIVAYDPSYHSLKQPSFVKNLEVTIADVGRKPSNPIL